MWERIPHILRNHEKEQRKMGHYKMMVLDLDGTLLNSSSKLEEATKVILQDCMRSGRKIVLCSSRSYDELSTIAEELYQGFEEQYCIGFGGAICYTQNGQSIVKADTIESDVADRIITLAQNSGIHIQGYDEKRLYYYRETEALETFLEFARVTHIDRMQISYEDFLQRSYLKLMCLGEMKKLEEYNRIISPLAGTAFSNPAGQQGYLDIVQSGVSKGTGVEGLCSYLGMPLAHCICVGDGDNDVSMLQKAGLGIAMKNGTDSAKAAADYVVPYSNDENAIGYLVKKFMV